MRKEKKSPLEGKVKSMYQDRVLNMMHRLAQTVKGRHSTKAIAAEILQQVKINLSTQELAKLYIDKYGQVEETGAPTNSISTGAIASKDIPLFKKDKTKFETIVAVDQRVRKDKQPRLLKRFRSNG